MNNYEVDVIGLGTLKRVSKTAARKLFNDGVTIYTAPSRVNLASPMGFRPYEMSLNSAKAEYSYLSNLNEIDLFDKVVNSIEYYNHERELGRSAWFILK